MPEPYVLVEVARLSPKHHTFDGAWHVIADDERATAADWEARAVLFAWRYSQQLRAGAEVYLAKLPIDTSRRDIKLSPGALGVFLATTPHYTFMGGMAEDLHSYSTDEATS